MASQSSIRQRTSIAGPRRHLPNQSRKRYADCMRQWERLLAVGLLIAATVVMTTYTLGSSQYRWPSRSRASLRSPGALDQWIGAQVEAAFHLRTAPSSPGDVSTAQGTIRKCNRAFSPTRASANHR